MKGKESMRNDHWSIMKPAYFIIWLSFNINIRFTIKKMCKTAILLNCFHTAGVLHIFVQYNLLGPGTSFYRKSKINIKRKPNYEIGWFHN